MIFHIQKIRNIKTHYFVQMDSCHCIFHLFQFCKMVLGSSVVYYGDEIGMTGFLDDLTNDTTRDPYVDVNCAGNDDENCYLLKSRDPMRTPMQVCNCLLILIIFSTIDAFSCTERN